MEIERKFLVKEMPDLAAFEAAEMAQVYISTNPAIRLRKIITSSLRPFSRNLNHCHGNEESVKYFLTVKGGGLMVREEFELPLGREQYEKLLPKAETMPVEKTRYRVPLEGGLTAELDVYHGCLTPLVTLEVEFETAAQADAFTPPNWFGAEVTHNPEYKNSFLAKPL